MLCYVHIYIYNFMLTKKNTVIAGQNLPLYVLSFRPTADCWERCWDSQGLGTTPLTNADSMGSSPIKMAISSGFHVLETL